MKFQETIKKLREENQMLQRQVAAALNIDTAIYCKIEKGDRPAKEEHIQALASLFGVSYKSLRQLWLADRMYDIIEDEDDAISILNIVAESIEKYKN